jgi:hypothetical protein
MPVGWIDKGKDMAQTQEANDRAERLARCLGFFASVIKAGEPWTDACEAAYQEALYGEVGEERRRSSQEATSRVRS